MDFGYDEYQALLRDSAARFVQQDCAFERRRALLAQDGFSAAHWKQIAQMGWLGAGLPESVGGYGGGAVETAIVAEQLGRGLALEPFVEAGVLAAQVLAALHDEPAAAAALRALIEGARVVVPALQPHGAELRDKRLSGTQTLVVAGPQADVFVVAAAEAGGLSLLLLDAAAPRLQRHGYRLIDGSPACDLDFDAIPIEPQHRLGPPGAAGPLIEAARELAIVAYCAQALGVMETALATTRAYLQLRRQFGVPIASFQALRHRLADMLLAQLQARATLHGALAALSTGDDAARRRAVATAKAQAGCSGRFVGAQAIQLHGGIGMTDECVVGHCFKRLMVLDRLQGHASAQLTALARMPEAA